MSSFGLLPLSSAGTHSSESTVASSCTAVHLSFAFKRQKNTRFAHRLEHTKSTRFARKLERENSARFACRCSSELRRTREKSCAMAWVLVKWLEENRLGAIPSSWVLEPSPIPETGLPMKGVCFWKRKSSKWDTLILAVAGAASHLSCVHGLITLRLFSPVSAAYKWIVHYLAKTSSTLSVSFLSNSQCYRPEFAAEAFFLVRHLCLVDEHFLPKYSTNNTASSHFVAMDDARL